MGLKYPQRHSSHLKYFPYSQIKGRTKDEGRRPRAAASIFRVRSLRHHLHHSLYHLADTVVYFMYLCLTHERWSCYNLVLLVYMDFVKTVKEITPSTEQQVILI